MFIYSMLTICLFCVNYIVLHISPNLSYIIVLLININYMLMAMMLFFACLMLTMRYSVLTVHRVCRIVLLYYCIIPLFYYESLTLQCLTIAGGLSYNFIISQLKPNH